MTTRSTSFATASVRVAALVAMTAAALPLTQAAAVAQPTSGMEVRGTIRNEVDTKGAYVGQDVIVDNVASSNGSIQNATLRGTVTSVQRAGQGKPARIQMHFNYLRLSNGTTYAISGQVLSMNAQTKSNAVKEAGGALAGMLVGNAIFKTLFASSAGGVIGAAGGFLVAKNNRENMTIPAGSIIAVQLSNVRRQSS